MVNADKQAEQHLLEQLEKAIKSNGQFSQGIYARFDQNLEENFLKHLVTRPWLMNATSFYYQTKLNYYEKKFDLKNPISETEKIAQIELLESLRFAIHFGCRANAEQRAWCFKTISCNKISPLHAPFLVWSRVINVSRQTIVLSHWDWISGVFMMLPAVEYFLVALLGVLSLNAFSVSKIALIILCLAVSWGIFSYFNSICFKAFKIGSKYFKPVGLRYTPIPRFASTLSKG